MKWMTVREAAEHARLSAETIREALRGGELRGGHAKVGANWVTREEWVDEWLMRVLSQVH